MSCMSRTTAFYSRITNMTYFDKLFSRLPPVKQPRSIPGASIYKQYIGSILRICLPKKRPDLQNCLHTPAGNFPFFTQSNWKYVHWSASSPPTFNHKFYKFILSVTLLSAYSSRWTQSGYSLLTLVPGWCGYIGCLTICVASFPCLQNISLNFCSEES